MALWIVCNRLLNEVKNERCVKLQGHPGPCTHLDHVPEAPIDWDKVVGSTSNISRDKG